MTNEEAANELIRMYTRYDNKLGDFGGKKCAAVTLAVAALSESASRDVCEQCMSDVTYKDTSFSVLEVMRGKERLRSIDPEADIDQVIQAFGNGNQSIDDIIDCFEDDPGY